MQLTLKLLTRLAALAFLLHTHAFSGEAVVIAGTGESGFSGDGGPALAAQLDMPAAIAFDEAGNLFIADMGNNRVRRVDAKTNIITTVAGNGTEGFSGDNGKATEASLRIPAGICLDKTGNLYVADAGNHRVRKVDAATGVITTVVGDGFHQPDDKDRGRFAGDGGAATAASLSIPVCVAFDHHDNLIIADQFNHRLRQVDSKTGIITTIAGNGEETFGGDGGKATAAALLIPSRFNLDAAGNVYITDEQSNRVRKIDAATGVISTLAGNGKSHLPEPPPKKGERQTVGPARYSPEGTPALESTVAEPMGVGVDSFGRIYFCETATNSIKTIDAAGKLRTFARGLKEPTCILFDKNDKMYIAEHAGHQIRVIQVTKDAGKADKTDDF